MPVKILVADDNKLILAMAEDTLTEAGFEVVTVESGLEVYKKVLAEKPKMVLLDIMMPGLDGIEICRNLKRSAVTKDLVIVIHSAFIIKSDNFDEMVRRVKEVAEDKLGIKI
jgi:two-component system alkaline phosphatase synthesis response regulator PhoP